MLAKGLRSITSFMKLITDRWRSINFSRFTHAYLPAYRTASRHIDGDFTAVLPTCLGTSKLLDSAIMALSATYIGQAYQDTSLRMYSLRKYIDAIKSVRTELVRMDAREDILYVTAILQTYETFTPSRDGLMGWAAHVRGCKAMLSEGICFQKFNLSDDNMYRYMQMVFVRAFTLDTPLLLFSGRLCHTNTSQAWTRNY